MLRRLRKLAIATLAASLPMAAALAQAPAAAPARPFAAPEAAAAAPAGSVTGIGEVTLALVIVLAAVFVVAWVLRRMRTFGGGSSAVIEVLAQTAVGARERAVLVKVGDTRLLLGVAPGRVSALHVLPPDAVIPTSKSSPPGSSDGQRPSFFALLQKSLGK